MNDGTFLVRAVGYVRSSLREVAAAPKQGDEGGPAAWVAIDPAYAEAMCGLSLGDRVIVLTWLHEASRDVLSVHPRDDATRPQSGVFTTRSSQRPNPIGLHPTVVQAIEGTRVRVEPLEAIDGTPVVDIKPDLGPITGR